MVSYEGIEPTGQTLVMPSSGWITNLTTRTGSGVHVNAGDRIELSTRMRVIEPPERYPPEAPPLSSRDAWLCAAGIAGVIVWGAFWWVYSSMV